MNQLRLVNLRIFTAATARQAAEVRAGRAKAGPAPKPSPSPAPVPAFAFSGAAQYFSFSAFPTKSAGFPSYLPFVSLPFRAGNFILFILTMNFHILQYKSEYFHNVHHLQGVSRQKNAISYPFLLLKLTHGAIFAIIDKIPVEHPAFFGGIP